MNSTSPVGSTLKTSTLSVFDADTLSDAVRSSRIEHSQLDPGDFKAELRRIDLGRLTLDSGCYTRKVIGRGDFPPDRVILGCVLNSREAGCINGYRFSRNDVVIFPEGSELNYVVPAATTWCSIQLSKPLLEESGCAEMTFDRIEVLPGNRRETARLARLMGMLMESQAPDSGSGLPFSPNEEIVLEQIRHTLTDHLGNHGQGRRPSLRNRMAVVGRFEQQVKDRIGTALRVPELCTELGISQRTLENIFKQEFSLTPKQFITILRLNAVRQQLLRAPLEHATVAEIAEHCGIGHLGRFAAAYLRQFDELPSETLNKTNL